ncbi:MAG: hypothetical protein LAN59_09550 [Acidobacteriia bacterium]|nr:hypothetical protein [Terriglobia bacterium]
MRVELLDERKKADWDRFVDTNPNVIAWHSYYYSSVLKQMYNLPFYPLAAYEGSALCGILPLYLSDTLRRGRILMSVPYFVAGGIVATNEEAEQLLLQKAIELGKETRAAHIALRQYKRKVPGELLTDDSYYNRELPLTADLDQIWKSISDANRAKVEETKKHNTVLEYPSADLDTFYKLLLHDQHGQGLPCVSRRWVELLLGTGTYHIGLLKQQGTVVAATLAKRFKDTVSFPLTCLPKHDEPGELFAYDLYWKLITTLAGEGVHIFHSGRIPRGDVAPPYRLGWGGTKCTYYYQSPGVGTSPAQQTNTRGAKRSLFESLWKRTPLSLAKTIGPLIVKQFP